MRDEIVQLVWRGQPEQETLEKPKVEPAPIGKPREIGVPPPRTGVEVVKFEERNGVRYYTMRDLRNGNVVTNVTKSSARRLWHYAISEYIKLPSNLSKSPIAWQGDIGVLNERQKGKSIRYDLAQKAPEGTRVYFGVTEDGIHGEWKRLVGGDPD